MNDSRSLIRNSVRSSERLFVAWMTRILNIITGSKGGRPPCRPVRIGQRRVQIPAETSRNPLPTWNAFELITEIAQPLQPIIDIEKSWLPSHAFSPIHPSRWNQKCCQLARFLEPSS